MSAENEVPFVSIEDGGIPTGSTKLKTGNTDQLELYSDSFFKEERENSLRSANIMVPLLASIFHPQSVVDFGCGAGAFLKAFKECGAREVLGLDGTLADDKLLLVPRENIIVRDLTKPLLLPSKYDLVISLEVAEHLDPESAPMFVANLARAGDIIVFSAAIPRQGGTHHVNEQWPEYWAKLFEKEGFKPIDCIRPLLWNNSEIDLIYSQNTILYVKEPVQEKFSYLENQQFSNSKYPVPLVHPRIYMSRSKPNPLMRNVLARKTTGIMRAVISKIR